MPRFTPVLVVAAALMAALPALQAQTSLGTFRWQLQPFCNVVTVTVVQQGSQFHIDGTDDLCGASRQASVVGRAFPNPDGTIGFGLTTVTTTGAAPIHLDARVDLATLGGPWTDSAGNSGTFAYIFTPVGTGGSVRPIPAGGIAPGTITSTQLAPGSVTATQLAPGAINAAIAALGACPVGQYLRGLQANGTLLCEPIGTPPRASVPDSANPGGGFSSIAIGSDGLPIISHADGGLRVTHCSDVLCTTATSTAIDTASNAGRYSSIAIGTDGLPIISHYDSTNRDLRVTHCHNVVCTLAYTTPVDTAGDVGSYSSIAIGLDGRPVISHWDATNGDLRVTHCDDVLCLGSTSTSVDIANTAGLYSSIAIGTDGLPVISHAAGAFVFPPGNFVGVLRVTHCSNRVCTAATSTNVATPNSVSGEQSSIAIGSDGWPVISSLNPSNIDLQVTHCDDALCTTATSTTVDTENFVGQFSSLAIGTDGLPLISHYDGTNGDLRVTHCSNVACTAATSVNVDAAGDVGRSTSIAIGTNGLPVISHQDATNTRLRVTTCGSRTCQ